LQDPLLRPPRPRRPPDDRRSHPGGPRSGPEAARRLLSRRRPRLAGPRRLRQHILRIAVGRDPRWRLEVDRVVRERRAGGALPP